MVIYYDLEFYYEEITQIGASCAHGTFSQHVLPQSRIQIHRIKDLTKVHDKKNHLCQIKLFDRHKNKFLPTMSPSKGSWKISFLDFRNEKSCLLFPTGPKMLHCCKHVFINIFPSPKFHFWTINILMLKLFFQNMLETQVLAFVLFSKSSSLMSVFVTMMLYKTILL